MNFKVSVQGEVNSSQELTTKSHLNCALTHAKDLTIYGKGDH
jgi:hypothetical protein